MDPDRWKQVEELYHATLEREESVRLAFLEEACAGDEALRRRVESLLAHYAQASSSFLEEPALEIAAKALAGDRALPNEPPRDLAYSEGVSAGEGQLRPEVNSQLSTQEADVRLPKTARKGAFGTERHRPEAGGVFGPYLIVRLLGTGGFGQVWEAESLDTGRRVALKVLTEIAAAHEEALRRFEQEGRLAASLSHPNCVYLFDAHQIEGYATIAMELMPGGTLQDRLSRQGALPVKEAVDFTLQIIDGLEAAHEAGIVHRDVKPSNCFLDADGHAKIGDFGVSKALEGAVDLTLSGSFVGTPSYASPEQVRGRDLDLRSDIYSVGATLYALLTGKPPFAGKQAGEVLARIVAEEPTPFSEHRVKVPEALQRIVLRRALAKDRDKRYRDYASLREALLPFSSRGLTAATLARRLGAIAFDSTLFLATALPVQFWGFRRSLQPRPLAAIYALSAVPWFLYFVVTEKRWGQSLGKFLFGLRVTTPAGSAITLGQACLRSAVFVYFVEASHILLSLFPVRLHSSRSMALAHSLLLSWATFYAILVSTMRQSNGYAGLHEIWSETRVRAIRKPEVTVLAESMNVDTAPVVQPCQRFGPYRVTQTVWEKETEALFGAYDDTLHRRIWVHAFGDACEAAPVSQLAAARPGHLHWFQGSRATDNAWDAYEAPPGMSFLSWVRAKGRLSWDELRPVLSSALVGISARLRQLDSSSQLSLSQIWIGASGQARILDFPAALEESQADDLVALADWKKLIHQLVLYGLGGTLFKLKDVDSKLLRVPLPEHTRPVMQSICQDGPASQSPEELIAKLDEVADLPARITVKRRAGPVLLIVAMTVLLFLIIIAAPRILAATVPDWMLDFIRAQAYAGLLPNLEKTKDREDSRMKIEAIRKVLASSYRKVESSPQAGLLLAVMPEGDKAVFESALKDYPAPAIEEVSQARMLLDSGAETRQAVTFEPTLRDAATAALSSAAFFSIPAIIFAFLSRNGPLLYLFGIAIQTEEGSKASRWRCLVRAFAAWSLLLLPWLVIVGGHESIGNKLLLVLGPLTAGGAVYSIIRPERGIQDRIAGTYLVPR
jgi:uncharacterized RDD family membrane protein YckC